MNDSEKRARLACAAHGKIGSLLANSQPEVALKHLREASRLEPNDPDTYVKIGDVLARGGQFQKAAAAYQLALENDPTNETASNGLRSLAEVHGVAQGGESNDGVGNVKRGPSQSSGQSTEPPGDVVLGFAFLWGGEEPLGRAELHQPPRKERPCGPKRGRPAACCASR